MVVIGKVRGSFEQAQPIVIGKSKVYVHTNIKKVEDVDKEGKLKYPDMYEYDEVQYDKDEYITMLNTSVTDLELAMVELYEGGIING